MGNVVMVVVHTLKPSSLAHSLSIHCIGLTGLRSHASWTWPEKRDPTIGAVCGKSLCASKCNGQSRWGQALANRSPSGRPLWWWYKLHESLPLFPKTHRRCRCLASTQAHTSKRWLRGKGCSAKRGPRGFWRQTCAPGTWQGANSRGPSSPVRWIPYEERSCLAWSLNSSLWGN